MKCWSAGLPGVYATILLLCSCPWRPAVQAEVTEGDEDFVDPFDILNFDPVHVTMKAGSKTPNQEELTLETPSSLKENSHDSDGQNIQKKPPQQQGDPNVFTTGGVASDLPVGPEVPTMATVAPTTTKKQTKQEDLSSSSSSPSSSPTAQACDTLTALFKQYLQQLLHMMEPQAGTQLGYTSDSLDLCLRVRLSQHTLHVFREYSSSTQSDNTPKTTTRYRDNTPNIHEVHEELSHMLLDAHRASIFESRIFWLEEMLGVSSASLVQISIITSSTCLLLATLPRITLRQVVPLLFVASAVFTWFEMFQKEQANQEKILSESSTQRCPSLASLKWYERMSNYLSSTFTFQDENCREFYHASVVNPVFKINPLEVCAIVVVKTVTTPLEIIGVGLKRFLIGLLKDLPFQHQMWVMTFVGVLLAVTPFMAFGYRVRVPWLISIEPSPTTHERHQIQHQTTAEPARPVSIENLPEKMAALSIHSQDVSTSNQSDTSSKQCQQLPQLKLPPPPPQPATKQTVSHTDHAAPSNANKQSDVKATVEEMQWTKLGDSESSSSSSSSSSDAQITSGSCNSSSTATIITSASQHNTTSDSVSSSSTQPDTTNTMSSSVSQDSEERGKQISTINLTKTNGHSNNGGEHSNNGGEQIDSSLSSVPYSQTAVNGGDGCAVDKDTTEAVSSVSHQSSTLGKDELEEDRHSENGDAVGSTTGNFFPKYSKNTSSKIPKLRNSLATGDHLPVTNESSPKPLDLTKNLPTRLTSPKPLDLTKQNNS